jgi:hypothetical protein
LLVNQQQPHASDTVIVKLAEEQVIALKGAFDGIPDDADSFWTYNEGRIADCVHAMVKERVQSDAVLNLCRFTHDNHSTCTKEGCAYVHPPFQREFMALEQSIRRITHAGTGLDVWTLIRRGKQQFKFVDVRVVEIVCRLRKMFKTRGVFLDMAKMALELAARKKALSRSGCPEKEKVPTPPPSQPAGVVPPSVPHPPTFLPELLRSNAQGSSRRSVLRAHSEAGNRPRSAVL